MERHLFNKIMIAVCNHDSYFVQKNNAFGVIGLLHAQKIIAALRMLAYGASAEQVDEIVRMGKSTILESLMRFCRVIESIYTAEYLRRPTKMDLQRLLKKGEMRGAQNDLNVLTQSPVFNDILQGKAPKVTYWVNIHKYDGPYYLANSIYPRWSVARMFDLELLRSIMMTCIILHNMIVEEEYDYNAIDEYEADTMNNSRTQIYCAHDATEEPVQHKPLERDGCYNEGLIQRYTALQRPYMHNARQINLIEYQWELKQAQDT
ncbi:uncharacterized protein [Malus domestica]|uniref:uncharacterized protein n=1 Tax=Malus domestica TaxID=3750 RepID=UPI003974759F